MKIMELRPCISSGSHSKGVSSEWCPPAAPQSQDWQSFLTTHSGASKPLTHLLPEGITSSFLPFTAELFHMAFLSHAWQAHSRFSESLPFLPLILLPCSDFNSLPPRPTPYPILSLSPSPSWFLRELLLHLCLSFLYAHGPPSWARNCH